MKRRLKIRSLQLGLVALLGAGLGGVARAEGLPAMGEDGSPWHADVIYENDTHFRGKDEAGHTMGLSKFRNTLQVEADKGLGDGWALHSVLRGTYDGVYDLNDTHYGTNAGGAITIQNTAAAGAPIPAGPPGTTLGQQLQWLGANAPVPQAANQTANQLGSSFVPWGGGLNWQLMTILGSPGGPLNGAFTAAGIPATSNTFGFNATNPNAPNYNPNKGLIVLGQDWHPTNTGGVEFGVPVRPCNVDHRGCADFGGYGNENLSQLQAPEFNNKADFIREVYLKKTFGLTDGTDLFLKVGRQQIVWGRTDLFRVLDVFNPVDYSRNNIYDELQDIRIPLWSAQAEWRMGGSESMQDRNLQFVWSFDQFRANNLGQCGQPNVILDAGCFFRGMKNLWDNGGTVANFAVNGTVATDFGPGTIGIRNIHLPNWSEAGTYGAKFEGVTQGGLSFSLNALSYRSQLPSLHAFNSATNAFTGQTNYASQSLIAFDMYFPRIKLVGGSLDFQSEDLGAAFRVEGAFTSGEEFANSLQSSLYSSNNVFRSVIGVDRPTFIPFINPNRTTLISGQLFYQHIYNYQEQQAPLGRIGMADWQDNVTGTLLIKGFLMNDRLSPQIIFAHDFKARATVMAPQVEWNATNDSKWTFGANLKLQNGIDNWIADDCRTCNPFNPFTAYNGLIQGEGQSLGMSGIEPLGRFQAGPIGAAWKQNEVYVSYRVKF